MKVFWQILPVNMHTILNYNPIYESHCVCILCTWYLGIWHPIELLPLSFRDNFLIHMEASRVQQEIVQNLI